MRSSYAYLDLGFFSACNLTCTYCRDGRITDDRGFTAERLFRQVEAFLVRHRAACVKLSGYGEVSLWSGFTTVLPWLAERFPKVQVISNGTFGKLALDAILALANISPNLTLDGHLPEMNRLRTGDRDHLHQRMFENLWALVDAGRRVEVNCVVHRENGGRLHEFCRLLSERGGGRVMLFPYPVKQFKLAADSASWACDVQATLADLARCAVDFPDVLPPGPYMADLMAHLALGRRVERCHVHWANLGSGGGDTRLYCPNYGESLSYGPMEEALGPRRAAAIPIEAANFALGRVGPECAACFNHFHVLNAWLERRMALDELLRLPSLDALEARHILETVRDEFDQEAAQ